MYDSWVFQRKLELLEEYNSYRQKISMVIDRKKDRIDRDSR